MAEATDVNLSKAVTVYVNNMLAGTQFTYKNAMVLMGIDHHLAMSELYQTKMSNLVSARVGEHLIIAITRAGITDTKCLAQP